MGYKTSSTRCVQHELPHDQRRKAGRIPGWGSVMGGGMASHTAWRARVTASGAEREGSGGRRGHRSQRLGPPRGHSPPQQSHQHRSRATSESTWSKVWERPGAAPQRDGQRVPGPVVDAAGFHHQLSPQEELLSRSGNTAGLRVQMPKTNPHAGPGQRPVEGCPRSPTHLALASCSCPAPRPPLAPPPLGPGTSPGGRL